VPELDALFVGDLPSSWTALGFIVDGGTAHASGVRFVLGAEGSGIRDWSFRLDGATEPRPPMPAHPNGVIALDHLVLTTPNLDRTIDEFESQGHELRRIRETGTDERPMRQAFFKAGAVVLELVGPRTFSGTDGPMGFWGLAWKVADLDATAAFYGSRLRPSKPAVQPGRGIATLDRAAGSSVAMAFMSP
jgi:hypothetical protein